MALTSWERHGRRSAGGARTEATLLRRKGKSRLAALGEFALPHAGDGTAFGQTVLHRGDDLVGKRNLRIGRCQMRIGRRQTLNLRGLRSVSDPGFECIELVLEVRERFLQISQFFRAGISMHTILPGRCRRGRRARVSDGSATHQSSLPVERPPAGGLPTANNVTFRARPGERCLDSSADRPGSRRRRSRASSLPRSTVPARRRLPCSCRNRPA